VEGSKKRTREKGTEGSGVKESLVGGAPGPQGGLRFNNPTKLVKRTREVVKKDSLRGKQNQNQESGNLPAHHRAGN